MNIHKTITLLKKMSLPYHIIRGYPCPRLGYQHNIPTFSSYREHGCMKACLQLLRNYFVRGFLGSAGGKGCGCSSAGCVQCAAPPFVRNQNWGKDANIRTNIFKAKRSIACPSLPPCPFHPTSLNMLTLTSYTRS